MKKELITIDKSKVNRLQDIAYLLQVCLNEFQKELDHFSISTQNGNSDKETIQSFDIDGFEPISKNISSFKQLLDSFVNKKHKEVENLETTNFEETENAEIDEIKDFFRTNNNLLHSVYYKDKNGRVITYYITLKDDCTENRSIIFDFFDNYETENEVSFFIQFVPLKLVDKFSHFNKLELIN